MDGARLTDCALSGIGGVTSFAGATISTGDLIALSHTLAAALNITVSEGAARTTPPAAGPDAAPRGSGVPCPPKRLPGSDLSGQTYRGQPRPGATRLPDRRAVTSI